MGVYVKGMEMPSMCAECDFMGGLIMPDNIYTCDCPVDVIKGCNITRAVEEDCKHPDCPLVEVPTPHGRLIDADRLDKHILYAPIAGVITGDGPFWTNIVYEKHINSTPTVIEAEGE